MKQSHFLLQFNETHFLWILIMRLNSSNKPHFCYWKYLYKPLAPTGSEPQRIVFSQWAVLLLDPLCQVIYSQLVLWKKTERRRLSNLHFLAGRVCDPGRELPPVSSFRKPIYLWIRWPEPLVNITMPSANHLSIFYCEIFFQVHIWYDNVGKKVACWHLLKNKVTKICYTWDVPQSSFISVTH